jgi:hypothetical protein
MPTELIITIEGLGKKNMELFTDWIINQAGEWSVQDEEEDDAEDYDWSYEIKTKEKKNYECI